MNYTKNLNLKKPGGNDYYDIDNHNDNYDAIDEAIGKIKAITDNIEDDIPEIKSINKEVVSIGETVKRIKEEITEVNANAELIEARGNEKFLGNRLDKFDEQLDTKAKESDLIVERERINNLTKLDVGSTTGDAELIDGRVGVNGITHSNIGGNIRDIANGSGIKDNAITPYKTNFISYDDIMLQDGIVVGAINSVGSINSSLTGSNTSDFIPVEEGMPIDIPGKIKYLAYYNTNRISLVSSLGRLSNLSNYKGVIPTNIDKVKYIRITWSNEEGDENYRIPSEINIFKTDKINLLTSFKDKSINYTAINGIDTLLDKNNDIYFNYDAQFKSLTIYMKTIAENVYLGYRFRKMTAKYDASNSSSNYDVWRLRGVGVYTKEGDSFTDILPDGLVHESSEWECAIKETGLSDFTGGSTHGDEFIDSIVFILDGVVYSDPSQFSTKTCKELRIIRKSKLYRANTNSTTYIADHYVDYLFKNNEIIIDNRVDWKVNTNCGISYLCMLGAKRLNGTTQITNRGIKSGDGSILDVSIAGHANNTTTKRCTKAYLWNNGTNGGVKTNMSIEILDNNYFPNFNFKFDNRSEYNKFYFDQCGSNFEVKTGDIWFNKALYKIDYFGMY